MLYMSQESTYMLLCIVTWVVQIYFLLRPGIWVIPNLPQCSRKCWSSCSWAYIWSLKLGVLMLRRLLLVMQHWHFSPPSNY